MVHGGYWIPLSMMLQLPGWHITSFLKGYLSFMPVRSSLQMLRVCAPFQLLCQCCFPRKDSHVLISLSSNTRLLVLLCQLWSSQTITCLPGRRIKSFCTSHSSLRGTDLSYCLVYGTHNLCLFFILFFWRPCFGVVYLIHFFL